MIEQEKWVQDIEACTHLDTLENLRIQLLGKSGVLTTALKMLKESTPEEKKTMGKQLNELKVFFSSCVEKKRTSLQNEALNARLKSEYIDVTLPVKKRNVGRRHLLSVEMENIQDYFERIGFAVVDGPEVEEDYYNFTALNIPEHHPARQSHDTFYIKEKEGFLLRTHTSNTQIRTLEKTKPPLRILSMGRVYRRDAFDATHSPLFHQVEGLVLEEGVHMGHMKKCMIDFLKYFFNVDTLAFRFRPSFFPFTEPSAEMDIQFSKDKWLEVLGCGMVHPNVLKNCQVEGAQGFAFGVGVERLVMLKHNIRDIRALFDGDQRFLNYYGNSQ